MADRIPDAPDLSELAPSRDPAVVRHLYEETLGRMQAALDDLVAATPNPVAARLTAPLHRHHDGAVRA